MRRPWRSKEAERPKRELTPAEANLVAMQQEGARRAAQRQAAAAEAAAPSPASAPAPSADPPAKRRGFTTAEIAALAVQSAARQARQAATEAAAAPISTPSSSPAASVPSSAPSSEEQAPAAEGTRGAGMVVRLLPSEREAWHAAAKEAGYGKTARWVRDVVNAVASGGRADPTRRAPRTVPPWVRQDLAAIGNNINQLAYRANAAAREGQPIGVLAEEVRAVKVELELLRLTLGADEE